MSALLELDSFTVRRGGVPVVQDVSLRLPPGGSLAVLGDNGAGKTSLLMGIMGLAPASGGLRLAGRDLAYWPTHGRVRAGLGYCPDHRGVFPGLTARETLAAACRHGDRAAAIRRCLALFPELAERVDAPSWQLSGGQQQMLSLARAMIGGPRLLLLDEPSLGLAPPLRARLADMLAILRRQGVALLLVEQDAEFAKSLCQSWISLHRGRLSSDSTSAAVTVPPPV
jgi:branched-chain amino acid transport system ATP-binding protein